LIPFVVLIVKSKGPITLEPSCHTLGVTIFWANWCQNTRGRNIQPLMLTTMLVLTKISKPKLVFL